MQSLRHFVKTSKSEDDGGAPTSPSLHAILFIERMPVIPMSWRIRCDIRHNINRGVSVSSS
jgi:hypothetical protein